VRHAHAGSRSAWKDADALRPLSNKGQRQAAAVADELAEAGVARLLSSPATRCEQTLDPLARRLDIKITPDLRLAEGSRGNDALMLLDELAGKGATAAVCSHGDVIPELLGLLRLDGVTFHDDFTWPKGSVWAVSGTGKRWTDARLILPTLAAVERPA